MLFLSDIMEEEIGKRASFSLNFLEAYFYWSILCQFTKVLLWEVIKYRSSQI